MALKPWGGNYANLLHCLRSQGPNQLTGRDYPGVCETVLPMPGCSVRAHVGIRADFQALTTAPHTTPGNALVRTHPKFAGGTAAGAVSPSRRVATRLTAGLPSPTPRLAPSSSIQCRQAALPNTNGGYRIGMPAAQAYKPPRHSQLNPTIVARRYPRSGREPVKTTPKNISRAARTCPRPLPANFKTHLGAPNYRFEGARSTARSDGYLAWVQGTALPLGGRVARDPHEKLSAAN